MSIPTSAAGRMIYCRTFDDRCGPAWVITEGPGDPAGACVDIVIVCGWNLLPIPLVAFARSAE